jgi:F0F1-type ATP synthase epsilon subunit
MATPTENSKRKTPSLDVKVIGSDKTLYAGSAKSVSSENEEGRFDVLPGHQSFISIIGKNILIQTSRNEKVQFRIGKGILKCIKNNVEILIGLESL